MGVQINSSNGVLTAYISGEIDHHSAPALRGKIDEVIRSTRPREVRLDFYNVTFMDSSGVGLVMGRYRMVRDYGGHVQVMNLSDSAYKVMNLSGLSKLMTVSKREEHEHEAGK